MSTHTHRENRNECEHLPFVVRTCISPLFPQKGAWTAPNNSLPNQRKGKHFPNHTRTQKTEMKVNICFLQQFSVSNPHETCISPLGFPRKPGPPWNLPPTQKMPLPPQPKKQKTSRNNSAPVKQIPYYIKYQGQRTYSLSLCMNFGKSWAYHTPGVLPTPHETPRWSLEATAAGHQRFPQKNSPWVSGQVPPEGRCW